MNRWTDRAWWGAVGTAALLFLTGSVTGVLVDRLWLNPPESHATPLTAEAMAAHLGLEPAEEAHLRALLDSLHDEIVAVTLHGPDSLGAAVRAAQLRVEAALPAHARAGFHSWMKEHHEEMMGRMHGGSRYPRARHGGSPAGGHTEDQHRRP